MRRMTKMGRLLAIYSARVRGVLQGSVQFDKLEHKGEEKNAEWAMAERGVLKGKVT